MNLPPRIKARVGQATPGQGVDGKWFFEIIVANFYGENIGEPFGPIGPFDTEQAAQAEMRNAVRIVAESLEVKISGEKSGQYMDMKDGGILKKWEMH